MNRTLLMLSLLPGLIIGLTLHEAAHAWAAHRFGDDFAKSKGRLTLNPLRHLSFTGTVMLLILGFGWARPVPVNMYNLRSPRRDFILIALVGPAANLVLCIVLGILLRLSAGVESDIAGIIQEQIFYAYLINGVLCVVNLLPIPPLDGSRLWGFLLPGHRIFANRNIQLAGIVFLMVFMFSGMLDKTITSFLFVLSRIVM
jgi:Zn-dependent protease